MGHQFQAGVDAELGVRGAEVVFDGFDRNQQCRGDLCVGGTLSSQVGDT